jgi:DNA (cytosine-5)-methyltransferase 1
MGYHRAGFDVMGVDIAKMPWYPFEFHQGDALTYPLEGFDAIHASPPCQRYALASKYNGRSYPDLIEPTRDRLVSLPIPWVIENVPRAPLRPDYKLCGCMFGLGLPELELQLRRERWFETSWHTMELTQVHNHWGNSISIAGHGTPAWMRKKTGHVPVAVWRQAMDIGWMRREELTEAIPPAYTEHIGRRLLEWMGA